ARLKSNKRCDMRYTMRLIFHSQPTNWFTDVPCYALPKVDAIASRLLAGSEHGKHRHCSQQAQATATFQGSDCRWRCGVCLYVAALVWTGPSRARLNSAATASGFSAAVSDGCPVLL